MSLCVSEKVSQNQLPTSTAASSSSSSSGKMSWLKREGDHLVDEAGKRVTLRGVNLGGWLVEEIWMMPFVAEPPPNSGFKPVKDHVSLWSTIESRFGKEDKERIRKSLRDTWITDDDFLKLKEHGFNCVRLPFLCDSMEERDGLFPLLDKAIDAAERHKMYLILDMHGTYGRQSSEHHTGSENVNQMFGNAEMVKKTVAVWALIARRYKDCSTVAGYDLMNEPTGASTTHELHKVHDTMYRALRAIDARHLIFIEDGFKGIEHIPNPEAMAWENVVISPHTYFFNMHDENEFHDEQERNLALFAECQKTAKAPVYIGEFNFQPQAESKSCRQFLSKLQEMNISWSLWTYKYAGNKGGMSPWGLYCHQRATLKPINPFVDSVSAILTKIQQLFTCHFEVNGVHDALLLQLKGDDKPADRVPFTQEEASSACENLRGMKKFIQYAKLRNFFNGGITQKELCEHSSVLDTNWNLQHHFGQIKVISRNPKALQRCQEELAAVGLARCDYEVIHCKDGSKLEPAQYERMVKWGLDGATTEERTKKLQEQMATFLAHFQAIKETALRYQKAVACEVHTFRSVLIIDEAIGFGRVTGAQSANKTRYGTLFRKAMRELDADWDMFYFMSMYKAKKTSNHLALLEYGVTETCYAVSAKMYPKALLALQIIDEAGKEIKPVDHMYATLHKEKKAKAYVAHPPLCYKAAFVNGQHWQSSVEIQK